MDHPVVLVTGATSGIGRETVRQLADRGARVLVHGRSEDKVADLVAELGGDADGFVADYASLSEVAAMAEELRDRVARLDVLVNNAGTYELERNETIDGYERTFQVNQLAPFLLTNALLPLVTESRPSRVVTVTSGAHARGHLDFADLMHERSYDAYGAYADSKLANVLFCYALALRLQGGGVTSNCLHPGAADTEMLHTAHPGYEGRPVPEAAAGIVCLALDDIGARHTGTYFLDCEPSDSSPESRSEQLQERLWEVSERLTRMVAP